MASDKRLTKHHVPPKHPDQKPRFIETKKKKHHHAYHLLFDDAKSFEETARILKKDWWDGARPEGNDKRPILWKEWEYHYAYNLLFGAADSFKMAALILKHDWWEPPHPQVCSYDETKT